MIRVICFVIHIDDTGNLLWENCYGGSGIDDARQVYKTANNGYLLFGASDSRDGDVNQVNCPYTACYTNTWVIDVDCEPYPINNGKSAWVYRLYDPLDGVNSLSYASLKTYPNPANNQLFIDLPEHHNKVEIEIIDVFGHAIKKINALAQQTQVLWDCTNVATGVYFYQSEINGVVYRGKIVVQ